MPINTKHMLEWLMSSVNKEQNADKSGDGSNGGKIKLTYTFNKNLKGPFKPTYSHCNEEYCNDFLRGIENLTGIERAVLICGDGEHVLSLVSLLETNNKLKSVDVIDRNPDQLGYFAETLAKLAGKSDVHVPGLISHEPDIIIGSPRRRRKLGYVTFPTRFKYGTNFNLHESDMCDYLKSVEDGEEGVYFIYFSDALFGSGFIDDARSREILNYIEDSPRFRDGTILHAQFGLDTPLILIKKDRTLNPLHFTTHMHEAWTIKKWDNGYDVEKSMPVSTQMV